MCKDCPVCFSPVTLSIDETTTDNTSEGGQLSARLICTYLCGQCKWSSQECGVTSNADKLLEYTTSDNADDASEGKEKEKQRGVTILEISKDLEKNLQQRIMEKNKVGDELFTSITNMWAKREQEEQRRKRMMIGAVSATKGSSSSVCGQTNWSLETLEQSLLEKKRELDSSYTMNSEKGVPSNPAKDDNQKPATATKMIPQDILTHQQIAAQMIITTSTPQSRTDLLPLPVPYRARVSRRCRAELAAGRTGILVKPKLNPLEGDTSLRSGHGQWWKKDSSAVHVVPRIQLCRHVTDTTTSAPTHQYVALLKIKNPTLSIVRLRLSGPSLSSGGIDQKELDNILVDPFSETFIRGVNCNSAATASLDPTDFFVLEPADDPFLDVGKGKEDDPADVKHWDATSILGGLGNVSKSQLRVVATQGDTAWVELILCNTVDEVSSDASSEKYLAIPLSLQIEIGNGSWDASLVKRRDGLPEEEKDLVNLGVVALLR